MSTWYCIRTATRQERKVIDGLLDLARERSADIEAYLPAETRLHRLRGRKVTRTVPLLPGYLFVRVDPEHLWRVDQVEGVYQILGWATCQTAKQEAKLESFVRSLMDAQAAGEFDKTTKRKRALRHALKTGQSVKVSGGPFAGFIAQITALSGSDRVTLMLDIFGRPTPIEIEAAEVEIQDAAPKAAA